MLVPKGLPKAKVVALSGVLALALGVIAYLVYANFITPGVVQDGQQGAGRGLILRARLPQPPLFDPSFFSAPGVRDLQNNGNLPLQVHPTEFGNADPFSGTGARQP